MTERFRHDSCGICLRVELSKLATELDAEAEDWSNDPAAMGAKADAARRIREALS